MAVVVPCFCLLKYKQNLMLNIDQIKLYHYFTINALACHYVLRNLSVNRVCLLRLPIKSVPYCTQYASIYMSSSHVRFIDDFYFLFCQLM
jgi:hypothetical protein